MARKKVTTPVKASGSATKGRSADIAKFLKDHEGMVGDIDKEIDFCSTGSWVIDRIVGDGTGEGGAGGFPRGFMTEVYGKESCGKTTLTLQAAAECQRNGGLVVFADFEHSLRAQRHYLKSLGVVTNDPTKFIHLEPSDLQDGTKAIVEATLKLKPEMVIVDSVAAMIPRQFLTGDVDEAIKVGLHAKLVGVFVGTMNKILQRTNTALVLINQLRSKIGTTGPVGPTTDTTGGLALKFYVHLRLNMVAVQKISSDSKSSITGDNVKEVTDQQVKVTAVKNKMDRPFRSETVYIKFGKGIDGLRSLIELAKKRGVVTGSSWLEYVSPNDEGLNFKLQGVSRVQEHLENHPEVVEDMMPSLFPKVDVGEYLKAKESGELDDEDGVDSEMEAMMKEMQNNMDKV